MNATTTTTPVRRGNEAELVAKEELPPLQHFIDGAFTTRTDAAGTDIVNPSSGTVICCVLEGTAADVDLAVAAARQAQTDWGATTPAERSDLLLNIASRIEENADILARLESLNTGKPLATSRDDVSGSVDTFRFMAGAGRALTSLAAGDYATDHTSVILREPAGVVGVITPWNYPLLMAAWKIAPILAAGNALV
jgi:aminobutyraldehyde dehydrogenase